MKLCVLSSSFPTRPEDSAASAGLFVRDFCVELADLGHEVTVITQAKSDPEPQTPDGLDVIWYPWPGNNLPLGYLRPYNPRHALWMRALFAGARRALEDAHAARPIDHVIAMWAVPAGAVARGFRRAAGVPYSVWCLGSDIWTYGRYPILRNVVRNAILDAECVWSDGIELAERAEEISGRLPKFLPSSRTLAEGGGDIAEIDTTGPRFLFVGRYAPVKGVDVLLEAFARYCAEGGEGHLVLYGGGPVESALRARAHEPDLQDRVTMNGFAEETRYVSELRAADCVIIPSRRESIPLVLSDALQAGAPLIVSDTGDMGTLLREVPAGHVVPIEDATALTQALHDFAARGRSDYKQPVAALARRFSVATSAQRYADAIDSTSRARR